MPGNTNRRHLVLTLAWTVLTGPRLGAQARAPGGGAAGPTAEPPAVAVLRSAPGATLHEKLQGLYDRGHAPGSPGELEGWFAGRWVEGTRPDSLRGAVLGIEAVPARREEGPGDPTIRILSTWSDRDPAKWDRARPADLIRNKDMLRRGPRDGALTLDPAANAAVQIGTTAEGKFRFSYGIRILGPHRVLRLDSEGRKISFGWFFDRIEEPDGTR